MPVQVEPSLRVVLANDACNVTPITGGIHVGAVTVKPEDINDYLVALGSALRQMAEAASKSKTQEVAP